MIQDNSNIFLQ